MSDPIANNLVSCRICGTIMVKLARDICSKCAQKEEILFQKVKSYLRSNPGSSIIEVSKAVGCTDKEVDYFVQSGRLERIGAKIAHPCKICQKKIIEGIICHECKRGLKEQVTLLKQDAPTESKDNASDKSPQKLDSGSFDPSEKRKKNTKSGHVGKRKGWFLQRFHLCDNIRSVCHLI